MKLPGSEVCDGGVHILAWCSVCWCAGSGSRESSGPPLTASLVCPGIGIPSDDRDGRRDDNALASNVLLTFAGVVLLISF
jgi:hypothetical protein